MLLKGVIRNPFAKFMIMQWVCSGSIQTLPLLHPSVQRVLKGSVRILSDVESFLGVLVQLIHGHVKGFGEL